MTRALTAAGLATIGVAYGFARYPLGLYLPEVRAEFGLSVGQAGALSSASYLSCLAALLAVGPLLDRFGPRCLVLASGVLAAVGIALVACAGTVLWLVTGTVLAGASSGLAWPACSAVVDAVVPARRVERVMAVIPNGTALAVLVAGPVALLVHGPAWRWAWWLFAAAALGVVLWNARLLPRSRGQRASGRPGRWLRCAPAVPLLATALLYGVCGAVYWLFAVPAVAEATGGSTGAPALFWTVLGAAGVLGTATGWLIARLGLRRTHTVLIAAFAVAAALLGLAPASLPAVLVSAALYGVTFMAISGLLAVWSYRVFPAHPAAALSAVLICMGVGTILGPSALGWIADRHGLAVALLLVAGLATATLALRPGRAHDTERAAPGAGPRPVTSATRTT